MANSTKTFTSKEIGEWLATFYEFSTKEEYAQKLHAVRCIFDAENDEKFWDEVCESMKNKLEEWKKQNNK